jgi:hypothetical protein
LTAAVANSLSHRADHGPVNWSRHGCRDLVTNLQTGAQTMPRINVNVAPSIANVEQVNGAAIAFGPGAEAVQENASSVNQATQSPFSFNHVFVL